MSRRISTRTKIQRKLGQGSGADYKPWITTSEFNSLGTTSVIIDWKTGRGVHCLSQGETLYYYILRWDDNNIDIREQYPLDVEFVNEIADKNKIMRPKDVLTTDFIITKADGTYEAISIKSDDHNLKKRQLQKLCIEKIYWESIGVPFRLLLKKHANEILANNIRLIVEFYDPTFIFDGYSAIKHKIARKEIGIDLNTKILTNEDLRRYMA